MDVLVCADEVTNPKPHPEPVEKAVTLLGADPGTTVYVGDSIHDMMSGRAAGVRTAAALWGPFGRAHLEGARAGLLAGDARRPAAWWIDLAVLGRTLLRLAVQDLARPAGQLVDGERLLHETGGRGHGAVGRHGPLAVA